MVSLSKRALVSTVGAVALMAASSAMAQTRQFNVPSEEAAKSIPEFARQAGVQITAPVSELHGVKTPAIHGAQDIHAALATLLTGTGLEVARENSSTIVLRRSQAAAPTSERAEPLQNASLGEVVVTAQKREQSAKAVPMSLSVVSGTNLERRNDKDVQSLSLSVPGLMAYDMGGGRLDISIRGIDSQVGTSSVTGIYLDDIPLSGAQNSAPSYLDLRTYDVQRVEVLKGPQGTLFGEGAVGGVVHYVTNKPNLTQASGEVSAVLFGTQRGAFSEETTAVLNAPIISGVFGARLSGTFENDGGWITNVGTGAKNTNSNRLYDFRLQTLWQPTQKLSISTLVEAHHNDGPAENIVNIFPISKSQFIQAYDPNIPTKFSDAFQIYNITGNYDLGFAKFLSSTSYWEQQNKSSYTEYEMGVPPPGNPYPGFELVIPIIDAPHNQFSQEFRLSSPGTGAWKWLVGGNYTDDRTSTTYLPGYSAILNFGQYNFPLNDPGNFADVRSHSWAMFGDTSYTFFNKLEVGGGLRYYSDRRFADFARLDTPDTHFSANFNKLTYRVYAKYALTQNINIYANTATGFRSGGFNQPEAVSAGAPVAYEPENSRSTEFGLKSSFWNKRLGIDVAYFFANYTDQIEGASSINAETGQAFSYTKNEGDANLSGVEWSVTLRPSENLQMAVSGDIFSSRYTRASDQASVAKGDPLSFVPKATVQASATYDFHWAPEIPGSIDVSYNYRGPEVFVDRGNGVVADIVSSDPLHFLQVNATAEWRGVQFRLFVKNLLNELSLLNPDNFGFNNQARPRSFGIAISKHF